MKIKVFQDADKIVIETSIKETTFKKVQKYSPEKLKLTDKEGSEYFGIGFNKTAKAPSIGQYGVTFNKVTTEGYLALTKDLPADIAGKDKDAIQEYVTDLIAPAYDNLILIEGNLTKCEAEIDAKSKSIADAITVD